MKALRFIWCALVAIVLCFSLSSCGSGSDDDAVSGGGSLTGQKFYKSLSRPLTHEPYYFVVEFSSTTFDFYEADENLMRTGSITNKVSYQYDSKSGKLSFGTQEAYLAGEKYTFLTGSISGSTLNLAGTRRVAPDGKTPYDWDYSFYKK